jgi:tetratricopeptide (TPR) repeat protein/primosomal replication protein N
MRSIAIILLCAIVSLGQAAQSSNDFALKGAAAVEALKAGKLDSALTLNKEALEIGITAYGPDSPLVALVHNNLGVVYRAKEKYTDAIASFEEAARVFAVAGSSWTLQRILSIEALAVTLRLSGDHLRAEKTYLLAIAVAEAAYGVDSFEMFSPTLGFAKHLAISGKLHRADDFYIKAYRIAYKNRSDAELESVEDSRNCFVFGQNRDEIGRYFFGDALSAVREDIDRANPAVRSVRSGGIVNGRAISLPKPAYPMTVTRPRPAGIVNVRVLIDTEGKVIEAKATCGHPELAKVSVSAARRSMFSPTLIDGKPVKVSGVIVYNFVP